MPVDFSRAWFFEPVEFYSDNENGLFRDGVVFKNVNMQDKAKFENINISKAEFIDTDLSKVNFHNCTWALKGYKDIVLYDEIKTDEDIKLDENETEVGKSSNYSKLSKVETLYRLLKKKGIEGYFWSAVSHWHYREKIIQRKKLGEQRSIAWLGNLLYWGLSGYNERMLNAFISLVVVIFILSFVTPLEIVCSSCTITCVLDKMLASINILPYLKTGESKILYECAGLLRKTGMAFFQILLVIQIGLLGMTVRNKLRR